MRRLAFAPHVCLLVFAALAAACGSGNINGGNQPDANTGNCNGGICDAPLRFSDARILGCADPGGTPCLPGQLCFLDRCYTDTCVAQGDAGSACGAGEVCSPKCVPTTDPCQGMQCATDQTCVNGQCVNGCFSPSACIDKTCATDEFCQNGTCQKINPCDLPCGTGEICNNFCHVAGPCEGVVCKADEACVSSAAPDGGSKGTCVKNLCFGVTCTGTQICSNGTCIDTCGGACPCVPPAICIQNTCVNQCVPDCNPDHGKTCGSDDGCGHTCHIQDCGTGMTCNSDNMCVCDPSCAGKACGQLNACGDKCNVQCGGNETCDPNQGCVCNNATCGDACCASGQACINGACCSAAATCNDGSGNPSCCASGLTCEPNKDDPTPQCCKASSYCPATDTCCGGDTSVCNIIGSHQMCCPQGNSLCTGSDTCCPAGEQCFKATPAASDTSVCCSNSTNYCSNSGTCCDSKGAGWRCSNDESNCCPSDKQGEFCNLPAGATCCTASNEKCRTDSNGTDHECCTDDRWCKKKAQCCDVTGDHPDPICLNNGDNDPEASEICCNKGQTVFQGQCCSPQCPAPGTGPCNQSDGCGGFCTGNCIDPGEVCTQVTSNPPTYMCKVKECTPACTCGEYCVNGTCQPLCPPSQTLCGCTTCCENGCMDPSTGTCKVNP